MKATVFFALLSLCACSRAPEPLVNQTPAEQEQREAQDRLSITPGRGSLPLASPESSPALAVPAPVASIPQFASQDATEGAQAYAEALTQLKNLPPPPATIARDVLSNPSSITDSLNQLGAKIRALGQAKQQVEANLAPGEEQRWKAFQQSLDQ